MNLRKLFTIIKKALTSVLKPTVPYKYLTGFSGKRRVSAWSHVSVAILGYGTIVTLALVPYPFGPSMSLTLRELDIYQSNHCHFSLFKL